MQVNHTLFIQIISMWWILIRHQICNQMNGFMKRSYLDILDFLQTVAVAVKLQEKSHRRCFMIYNLCCYLHSGRKIRIILRICKFVRINWISKNWKNFEEHFMLIYYGLFEQQLESIFKKYIYLHTHLGNFAKDIFPCPALSPLVLNSFLFLSLDGMFYNFAA